MGTSGVVAGLVRYAVAHLLIDLVHGRLLGRCTLPPEHQAAHGMQMSVGTVSPSLSQYRCVHICSWPTHGPTFKILNLARERGLQPYVQSTKFSTVLSMSPDSLGVHGYFIPKSRKQLLQSCIMTTIGCRPLPLRYTRAEQIPGRCTAYAAKICYWTSNVPCRLSIYKM